MGVLKRGILGGFSGKVANIVGGSWKGIAYMRSLPLSVANPRTAGQIAQRGAFTEVGKAAIALLGDIVQPFWNQYASGMSGYNRFVSDNIATFDATGLITPADFKSTMGTVTGVPSVSATANGGAGTCTATWTDNTGSGNAQGGDGAIMVVYNETKEQWYALSGTVIRSTASMVLTNSQIEAADSLQVWLSFENADGKTGLPANTSAVAV